MDSKILEYIIAIAEEKNISRAAERFYLSQSVLSHHLKTLEEEFGEPFFTREPKGMQLTRAGIIFVNNARTILHLEGQLEEKMEEFRRRQFRSLKVMVDSTNRNYFIRSVLTPFQEEFPQTALELVEGNFIQAQRTLQDGGVDMAVYVSNKAAAEGCHSRNLLEDRLVFLLPSGFKKMETVEELRRQLDHRMAVCLHPVGSSVRLVEEEILAREKAFPSVILESRSFQTSLALARDGQCGIFFPQSIISQAGGELEPVTGLESKIYFHLSWAGEGKRPRTFQRLMEITQEAYRDFVEKSLSAPTMKNAGITS